MGEVVLIGAVGIAVFVGIGCVVDSVLRKVGNWW